MWVLGGQSWWLNLVAKLRRSCHNQSKKNGPYSSSSSSTPPVVDKRQREEQVFELGGIVAARVSAEVVNVVAVEKH
jgi:hypothetical protein